MAADSAPQLDPAQQLAAAQALQAAQAAGGAIDPTDDLSRGIQSLSMKAIDAADGQQARDFSQGALFLTQALELLHAPPKAPAGTQQAGDASTPGDTPQKPEAPASEPGAAPPLPV